jgi:hypothetical protein
MNLPLAAASSLYDCWRMGPSIKRSEMKLPRQSRTQTQVFEGAKLATTGAGKPITKWQESKEEPETQVFGIKTQNWVRFAKPRKKLSF